VMGMRGQWFVIAAIIVSATLLAISQILASYLVVDLSVIGRVREHTIFHGVVDELNKTIERCLGRGDCLERIEEFRHVASKELGGRGYYFDLLLKRLSPSSVLVEITLLSEKFNLTRTMEFSP